MDLQTEKYIYAEILKIVEVESSKHGFGTVTFHKNDFKVHLHENDEEYYKKLPELVRHEFSCDFTFDGKIRWFYFKSPNILASGQIINQKAITFRIDYDVWKKNSEGVGLLWEAMKNEKADILHSLRKKVS